MPIPETQTQNSRACLQRRGERGGKTGRGLGATCCSHRLIASMQPQTHRFDGHKLKAYPQAAVGEQLFS